jgi:hypothetical protein
MHKLTGLLTTGLKNIFPKKVLLPLGRWSLEKCNKKINNKIDLSNEDHCGPCGQYALSKIEIKKDQKDIQYEKK